MYGNIIDKSLYNPRRSVIDKLSTSVAGNLVLRVGHEVTTFGMDSAAQHSWEQTEHVVLTPDEAENFALDVLRMLDREQFEALYKRARDARDQAGIQINDAAVMRLVDAAIG